jgi:hypothetical protein
MRFLWFGKKKVAPLEQNEIPSVESFSVNNFVIVQSPLGPQTKTDLDRAQIASYLLSLSLRSATPADRVLQEYLQEFGANHVELSHYSHNEAQGHSAKVLATNQTLLLGTPAVIARVTTPFHATISDAIAAGGEKVLAIDGIAYAAFSINGQVN